jgi:hypothetical protein
MDAEFYTGMAATAADLIARFGRDVSLVRVRSEQDPSAGTVSETTSTLATRGIFLSQTVANVRESLAEGADRLMLIDSSQVPALPDRLVAGSVDAAIVRIDVIDPAGLPLAYVLHLAT